MYMQIRLPLACLLITIYCFWYYKAKKRLNTRTAKVFEAITVTAIIHLISAVVTEYTVNNRQSVPEAFNYIWHVIFLTSVSITSCLLLYYLILYIERGTGKPQKREKIILLAVCLTGVITQAVLPIEYVDTTNGSYSLGMKAYSLYCIVIYVLLMMIYKLIKYRKVISRQQSKVLSASVIMFAVICIIQIFYPYILLTSLALTLINLGIMVNMEDAHLYVSYKTGLYNEIGCQEMILEKLIAGKPFQIGVYVFIGNDVSVENAMKAVAQKFPESRTDLMCGMMADNTLIVIPQTKITGAISHMPENLPPLPIKDDNLKYIAKILDFNSNESATQIQGIIRDFKNRFEEDALQKDELTGLLRRQAFIRQVEYLITQKKPFAMMMLDLDDFKSINDSYGHGVGDNVLKYVASTFHSVLRSSDIICRMGGDEFAIILYNVTDPELINEITNRIMANLSSSDILPDKKHKIKISAGVKIHKPENGSPSFQELYAEADSALYRTKYNGKNGLSFSEM